MQNPNSFSTKLEEFEFLDRNWETQLAVLKAKYDTNDLQVKYLDEENEEIGLGNQEEYEYAIKLALKTNNGSVKMILRDRKGKALGRSVFCINPKDLEMEKPKVAENQVMRTESRNCIEQDLLNKMPSELTKEQTSWLVSYFDQFKKDIILEMESKMKHLVLTQSMLKTSEEIHTDKNPVQYENSQHKSFSVTNIKDEYDMFDFGGYPTTQEEKVLRYFQMIEEARSIERPIKVAFLEEELKLSGAFGATFVKDCNIPDGTRCEANMRFKKTWMIKNTGQLSWGDKFPVKLACIAGNIISAEEFVEVDSTIAGETTNISVDLVAPSTSGEFYSEWVLTCNQFQFGPRIWCTIEVIDSVTTTDFSSSYNNNSKNLLIQDDLDDEFVVIPDCLNLSKKWKATTSTKQTKKLTNEHLMECSYSEYTPIKTESLTSTVQNEENSEEPNTESISLKSEITESEKTTPKVELSAHSEQLEQSKQLVYTSLTLLQPSIPISTKSQKEDKESTSTQQSEQISAFSMVKDAFANVRGPTCVGDVGNLDFVKIQKETKVETDSANQVSNSSHSPVATLTSAIGTLGSIYQSTPENNMTKLISMGFADRKLNERLLKKYDDDLGKVIQHLLERQDNNWTN